MGEHLGRKFKSPPALVQERIDFRRPVATLVQPAEVPGDACRDANDLPVLGTAVTARAQVLVTGDKDLLALSSLRGIEILPPRVFHDRLR